MVYRSNRRKTQRKKVSRKHKRISSKTNIRGGMLGQMTQMTQYDQDEGIAQRQVYKNILEFLNKKVENEEATLEYFKKRNFDETQIDDLEKNILKLTDEISRIKQLRDENKDSYSLYKQYAHLFTDKSRDLSEPKTSPPPSAPPPPADLPMAIAVPSSSRLPPPPADLPMAIAVPSSSRLPPTYNEPPPPYKNRYVDKPPPEWLIKARRLHKLSLENKNTSNSPHIGGRLTNKIKRINKYKNKNKKSNKSYKPLRVSKPKRTNRRKLKSKKR